MTSSPPTLRLARVRLGIYWLIAHATLIAQIAPAPSATPRGGESPPADNTVVLSPFTVEAGTEKGYLATQTLSGTRLKTDLRDIGAALTIFTEQMMDDLGANSIYDIIAFAPNTDPFVNTLNDISGNGNDFINVATQYVTRGGRTSVVGQDFFSNGIPNDRFNSEAFTFSRGPNAILFGLGNPAGAFVSSTKRARNNTATTVELRTDDRDSFRATLDHNQVIAKDRLAVRYAGLYEKNVGFRLPGENFQRRHFITARYTPFKKTALRVNYEQGHIQLPAIRPWGAYDGVSPWLAAGRPLLASSTAPKPAGVIANNTAAMLVSTIFSPGGTIVPTMSWQNTGQTALPNYANGYPVSGNKRSFIRPDLYPTFASAHGLTSYQLFDYKIPSVFLEQQITRDLFVEAAYQHVINDRLAVNGFVGDNDILYADPNQLLPNGQPNPNVGRFYTESRTTILVTPNKSTGKRIMASYELDFGRQSSKWLRYLGRHRAAVFGEQSDQQGVNSNLGTSNVTPLATTGAAANIFNGANQILYRYYYDPASGKVGNTANQFARYPVVWADTPLPTRDPSGITPAYISTQGPSASYITVKTRAFALQSSFWKDRLILTTGLRNDSQKAWRSVPDNYLPRRNPLTNSHVNPSNYDVRTLVPESLRERDGNTFTRGAVFHATRWLSFAYNDSNNFQANDSTRDIYGELLPNPQGTGSDYSVKLALFDQRVFVDVTYYKNASKDRFDSVANTTAGNIGSDVGRIWEDVANFTNEQKYRENPYSSLNTVWSDNATTSSDGWELSATANPTRHWRVSINGSKRGTSTTTARGTITRRYLDEYLPLIKSHPEWQNLTSLGTTVAQKVVQLETTLSNLAAIGNLPADIYAPDWSVNMVQSYELPREAKLAGIPLGGVSIGGNMNMRGRSIDGFGETAIGILNPGIPYHAPRYEIFGAMISYKRKFFHNRVDCRLQLNVRNLFDAYTIFPLRAVDARDGNHTKATVIYKLNEPRTYTLSSTFRF